MPAGLHTAAVPAAPRGSRNSARPPLGCVTRTTTTRYASGIPPRSDIQRPRRDTHAGAAAAADDVPGRDGIAASRARAVWGGLLPMRTTTAAALITCICFTLGPMPREVPPVVVESDDEEVDDGLEVRARRVRAVHPRRLRVFTDRGRIPPTPFFRLSWGC